MLSDLQIAQQAKLQPIVEVAAQAGILREELELHGDYMAKVKLDLLERLADRPDDEQLTRLRAEVLNLLALSFGLPEAERRLQAVQ